LYDHFVAHFPLPPKESPGVSSRYGPRLSSQLALNEFRMWPALSQFALITFVLFVGLEVANFCLDIPELLWKRSLAPGLRSDRYQSLKSVRHRRNQSTV
jgi:hypothetical protein